MNKKTALLLIFATTVMSLTSCERIEEEKTKKDFNNAAEVHLEEKYPKLKLGNKFDIKTIASQTDDDETKKIFKVQEKTASCYDWEKKAPCEIDREITMLCTKDADDEDIECKVIHITTPANN